MLATSLHLLIDLATLVLLAGGVALGLSGALGVLRFPDFYTRIHAAGITDTLSAGMIIGGLMLQAGWTLVSVKLGLILLFLWVTSPVASHALARAAHQLGLAPLSNSPASGEPSSNSTSNT